MKPSKKPYRIGIDLGGTKMEGVVLDINRKVLFRKRIPTIQDKGYDFLLQEIADLYEEIVDFVEDKPHTFGIGTPGTVSKNGLIFNSNITIMNGKPFVEDLEKKIKRKFIRENDSNCFVIAEANFGAGKGKKRVFGAIMGTGIGGGMIFEGKLISGRHLLAGEWGHSIISSYGPTCHCGKIGCVETFISGKAIENKYQELTGEKLPMQEIVKNYRLGDDKCNIVMSEFFVYFGKAFANLITILDPDTIVLGGGLSNIDELYTLGVKKVRDYVSHDELTTPIVRNKLGDSAGVLGAALIGI